MRVMVAAIQVLQVLKAKLLKKIIPCVLLMNCGKYYKVKKAKVSLTRTGDTNIVNVDRFDPTARGDAGLPGKPAP